jgi:hypothetical protein
MGTVLAEVDYFYSLNRSRWFENIRRGSAK